MDFVIVKSMNIPAIRKVMNYHWNAFMHWWFLERLQWSENNHSDSPRWRWRQRLSASAFLAPQQLNSKSTKNNSWIWEGIGFLNECQKYHPIVFLSMLVLTYLVYLLLHWLEKTFVVIFSMFWIMAGNNGYSEIRIKRELEEDPLDIGMFINYLFDLPNKLPGV